MPSSCSSGGSRAVPFARRTRRTAAPRPRRSSRSSTKRPRRRWWVRRICAVEGTAHVEVGDESKDPHAEGIVQFVGAVCPGGSCAVGMQYKLDIDSVTFGNFFHSETFDNLGGIGETKAGSEAMLAPS